MKISLDKKLLRIYLDNTDEYNKEPLWKFILKEAQEKGLSGATVYKAVAGIGSNKELHTFDILNLSQTMPLIIEIIDSKDKITNFLKYSKEFLQNTFITLADLEVVSFEDKNES